MSRVMVGGAQTGGIVLGQVDGSVDDFERVVAIRIAPATPPAASASSASSALQP